MARISGGREEALEQAVTCRVMAALAVDEEARAHYRRLAQRWRRLAESYRLAERVSGHIEWRTKWLREQ